MIFIAFFAIVEWDGVIYIMYNIYIVRSMYSVYVTCDLPQLATDSDDDWLFLCSQVLHFRGKGMKSAELKNITDLVNLVHRKYLTI